MIGKVSPTSDENGAARGEIVAGRAFRTLRFVSSDGEPDGPAETVSVVLAEPARTSLITLAADVLGKLPPEDVPASLRTIARFAPAKRVRLGAVAIAAALDADEAFRGRVAQTVIDTSPDLVTAVRDGLPTAAADPLDVATVAYLTRPPGWETVLAQANERWRAARGGVDDEEVARLRAELADLRSQLRAERARTKQAVTVAREAVEAELADARRTVRDRTRELRAAEKERADTLAALSAAREELARLSSAHDTELRRLRGRLTEAERTAETARRDVRTDRDLDTARLWLLVDTVVQAAAGLRRELSLPAPTLRPGDVVESAAPAGPAAGRRSADDPAALDRLLAMPHVHLIVDGYNVTKSGYPELALAEQRSRLIGALAALHAQAGAEITVAFDGGEKPPAQPPVPRGLRVLFSAPGKIADDLIRRLVAAEPPGRPVIVVSSDGEVARDTARDGAWTVPSAVLLARLG